MGGRARLPQEQADFWRDRSRTVEALGKWVVQERTAISPGEHVSRWRVLKADRNAVDLLGYRLAGGRWPAETQDRCELLTAREGIGRVPESEEFVLDGRRCRVVGVLEPKNVTTSLAFELYEPTQSTNLPTHVGLIGRLKRESTIEQVQSELLATARLRKGWGSAQVSSVAAIKTGPLKAMGWLLPLMLTACASFVRAKTVRAWILALLQISLVFTLMTLVWLELLARTPVNETASLPVDWGAVAFFFPLGVGVWAVWWLRREQKSRCRICYRRMALAISVGSTASSLLNPGGVEYICRLGHGALVVGPAASVQGGETWASI